MGLNYQLQAVLHRAVNIEVGAKARAQCLDAARIFVLETENGLLMASTRLKKESQSRQKAHV